MLAVSLLKSPPHFNWTTAAPFPNLPPTAFICVFSLLISLLVFCQSLLTNLNDLSLYLRAIVSRAHTRCLFNDETKWHRQENARRNLLWLCWKRSSDHYQLSNTESTLTWRHTRAYVYQFAGDAVICSMYPEIRRHTSAKSYFLHILAFMMQTAVVGFSLSGLWKTDARTGGKPLPNCDVPNVALSICFMFKECIHAGLCWL